MASTGFQRRQCRQPSRLEDAVPPYIAHLFYSGGGELLFIAGLHSVHVSSSTHALIRHMVLATAPDRIVVEGYYDDPAHLLAEDLELFRRNIYPENRYVVAMAEDLGIRATGGDVGPKELARASLRRGFSPHDIVGTHIVRLLSGQLSAGRLAAVEALVRHQLGELFPASGFDFQNWYASRVGEAASEASVRRIYRGPCGTGIIAEVASFESETRNERLLATIAKARREVPRVAAVFGANHLYSTFDVLAADAIKLRIVTPAELPNRQNDSFRPTLG